MCLPAQAISHIMLFGLKYMPGNLIFINCEGIIAGNVACVPGMAGPGKEPGLHANVVQPYRQHPG
jgi:hypothetical protein